MRKLIPFFVCLSMPAISFAQAKVVSPSTGLLQIFLALAFVIALMLIIAWLFKRIGPIANGHLLQLKVVGGLNIGNREKVMVVEVADQWLVLGVTAQNINTLATMPKQELPNNPSNTLTQNNFADWLKKNLDKRTPPQP
jgi:flagellar protein FliO/FliZ